MDNARNVLDELGRINSCNSAISYLMCPDDDCIDRDKTSILIAYLSEREELLIEELHNLCFANQKTSNQG